MHPPTRNLLIVALAMAAAGMPLPAGAQGGVVVVPAGIDCWDTECGETRMSFCNLPLPPDFFFPGSQPFTGEVELQGRTRTPFDTQVQRLQDAELPRLGSQAVVPIELVQLNLVSCSPITVQGAEEDVQWDVDVSLSPLPAAPGQMTILRTHDNGGSFDSTLFVQPRFTFTRTDDPTQIRVLDTGLVGVPADPLRLLGEAPWVAELDPGVGAESCSPFFAPGVRQELKGSQKGSQCCEVTCHSGATATHCIEIDRDCSGCPRGACCLGKNGRCAVVKASKNATARGVCEGRGGVYHGDGTDCTDTDGDGIPDVKEVNNCCAPGDTCRVPSSPVLADSDGDGVTDGAEVKKGSDPCDPASVP